ncbi:hypothetical protein WICPIJ_001768 [Wickerhamomyces pijperi]|uniref:Glutathione hydrolase n=1 Tax=Wickerhamomyces pijperi TaxID=599730 RepID=A0A9P8QCW9_WICPI|nr:hypothetical protein WICPIJ_001768 [Wickerhamomyces pijperi]
MSASGLRYLSEKTPTIQPKFNIFKSKYLSPTLVLLSLACFLYFTSLETQANNSHETILFHQSNSDEIFSIAADRGIEIDPLIREPSLNPDQTLLQKSLKGAVSSDIEECSQIGAQILEKGGFAADAAVSVALCIGAINSFNSGIGGGGFITSKIYKDDNAISIDAREAAPLRSTEDMFLGRKELAKVGGLAAGIPGEIKGLYKLFSMHGSGKLTWEEVIQPVIDLTENGFNASVVLTSVVQIDKEFLLKNYDTWKYLFREGSKEDLIQVGDLVKRPDLSRTLELIAKNGSDAIFYDPKGPIASNLIKTANKAGGIFSEKDFEDYDAVVYPALKTKFLGNDVYTCQGSCSGPALITGLNIYDKFGLQEGHDMGSVSTHRLIETMKHMASARTRLGDLTNDNIELVTSKEYAHEAFDLINDKKTLDSWMDYKPQYEDNNPHGTTHFAIVDQYNNAVSMTSTINLLFGSMVMDPVTGIILNDEMDDFSSPGFNNSFGLAPSVYNLIRPGKKPLSSAVPTIIVNELGKPDFIIGAAGGSRIITAVFQAIVRIYSFNMPLLETLAYPRLHHQLLPDYIEHEQYIGSDILESLAAKGHNLKQEAPKTAMNGIRRWRGEWHAVSDFWRKRGISAVCGDSDNAANS